MNRFLRHLVLSLLGGIFLCTSVCAQEDDELLQLRPISGADSAVVSLEHNRLVFPAERSQFDSLFCKMRFLREDVHQSLRILHIGGSHVQADVFSGRMRSNLRTFSTLKPLNRGMIFPFAVLGTNGPKDYSCSFTGRWGKSRNIESSPSVPLGLSGGAVTTSDLSSNITFRGLFPFESILLYGKSLVDTACVIPVLVIEGDTIYPPRSSEMSVYEFLLPSPANAFTLAFVGDSCGSFSVRGMIADPYEPGLMYTASGINGAAVPSWLRCLEFEQELSFVAPNLVLFAVGINDANVQNFSPEKFKSNYRELISRIQRCNPQCAFLFITNNDCYLRVGRKRVFNPNTAMVEQAFMELAEEYDGAVWNLYQIMGGYKSSARWVKAGLMKSDHVHFTPRGYELIGDLLYNALLESYLSYTNHTALK